MVTIFPDHLESGGLVHTKVSWLLENLGNWTFLYFSLKMGIPKYITQTGYLYLL